MAGVLPSVSRCGSPLAAAPLQERPGAAAFVESRTKFLLLAGPARHLVPPPRHGQAAEVKGLREQRILLHINQVSGPIGGRHVPAEKTTAVNGFSLAAVKQEDIDIRIRRAPYAGE